MLRSRAEGQKQPPYRTYRKLRSIMDLQCFFCELLVCQRRSGTSCGSPSKVERDFCSSEKYSDLIRDVPSGYRVQNGGDINLAPTPPSSADVENKWSYAVTPPYIPSYHVQGQLNFSPLNPLNTELNPICHLLALLEPHHILHVSRIRVTSHFMQFCRLRYIFRSLQGSLRPRLRSEGLLLTEFDWRC